MYNAKEAIKLSKKNRPLYIKKYKDWMLTQVNNALDSAISRGERVAIVSLENIIEVNKYIVDILEEKKFKVAKNGDHLKVTW